MRPFDAARLGPRRGVRSLGTIADPGLESTGTSSDDPPPFDITATNTLENDVFTIRWYDDIDKTNPALGSASVIATAAMEAGSDPVSITTGAWGAGTFYPQLEHGRAGWTSGFSDMSLTGAVTLSGISGAEALQTTWSEASGDGTFIDFDDDTMLVQDTGTPAHDYSGSAMSKVICIRAGVATYIDQSSGIAAASANVARRTYDAASGLHRLLVEPSRTNLFLNSLIDGTNLSTQSVTVTAALHTISFYGDGSITLSGAHSATVNGSGAFPTRTSLEFTPSAGSLTCTVSGNVKWAQIELGGKATSFIPTAGSAVTRNADCLYLDGTVLPFSATINSFAQEFVPDIPTSGAVYLNLLQSYVSFTQISARLQASGTSDPWSTVLIGTGQSPGLNSTGHANKTSRSEHVMAACRLQANSSVIAQRGEATVQSDTSCGVTSSLSAILLGSTVTGGSFSSPTAANFASHMNGFIDSLVLIPASVSDANLISRVA